MSHDAPALDAEQPHTIVFGDDGGDYRSDDGSSTQSLTQSTITHYTLGGRTYHGSYWYPNDNKQQRVNSMVNDMMLRVTGGKLYHAPLKNPDRVLDVGTGTGEWAIEFADENPDTHVIGIDLSPIQPSMVPENCNFQIDDVSLPWTFRSGSFDFIHLRLLMGSIDDWSSLYKEIYKSLKPGGWVEHFDMFSDVVSNSSSIELAPEWVLWNGFFRKAGGATGKTFTPAKDSEQLIKDAGFVEVEARTYLIPIGSWPKDERMKTIGALNRAILHEGMNGYVLMLGTQMGYTTEEMDTIFVGMKKALCRNDRVYYRCSSTYAQKPLEVDSRLGEVPCKPDHFPCNDCKIEIDM